MIYTYKFIKVINNSINIIGEFIKRYFVSLFLSIFKVNKIPREYQFLGSIFLIINYFLLNLLSTHIGLESVINIVTTVVSKDISNMSSDTKIGSIKIISFLLGNFAFSILFSSVLFWVSKIKLTVSSIFKASGFAAFSGFIYFLLSGILSFVLLINDSIISNLEVVNQLLNNTSADSIDIYTSNLYFSYINIEMSTILQQYNLILIGKFIIFLVTICIWWNIIFSLLGLKATWRNMLSFCSSIIIIFTINLAIILGANYENIRLFYRQSTMYDEIVNQVKVLDSSTDKDYNKLNVLTNILAEDQKLNHKTRYSLYVYSILYEELYINQLLNLELYSDTKEIFSDVNNLDILDKVLLIEDEHYNFYTTNEFAIGLAFDSLDSNDILTFDDHLKSLAIKLAKAREQRKLVNENEVDEKLSIFAKINFNIKHNVITLDLFAI